jgi:hypothetical protein
MKAISAWLTRRVGTFESPLLSPDVPTAAASPPAPVVCCRHSGAAMWRGERRSGNVGVVGFEVPLTVETWRDYKTRSWFVQAFCVPAFAVDRPFAMKQITGIA